MTERGGSPSEREAFLRAIAANLRLDPDTELDVLDELADHLDDSIAGLRQAGATPDEAERQAVHRLGDPRQLARGLRRAHQRRRRLLAAAGGGILGVADGLARQVVPIFAVLTGATFAVLILAEVLRSIAHVSPSVWNVSYGSELAIASVLGFGGSRRMAWAIARTARRPLAQATLATAILGATAIGAWALAGPPVTFNDLTVGADLLALGAWLAGCLSVGRVADLRLTRPRWLVASLGVGALMLAAQIAAVPPSAGSGHSTFDPDLSRVAAKGPWFGGLPNYANQLHVETDGTLLVDYRTDPETPNDLPLDRARHPRLELWPAQFVAAGAPFPDDEVGELDPRATAPLRATALSWEGDHLVGSIRFDDIRGLRAAWIVTTATIDGRRYVIDSTAVAPRFRGNVLGWLSQPADPIGTTR